MASTFVLAPVPTAARRRRANSRTAPSTNFAGRSRSGSNASCTSTRTRSRSRRPSLHHASRRSPTTPSASFVNFIDTPADAKQIADLLRSPATPSYAQISAHLQALGYQTSFLKSADQSPRPIFRRIFSKSQPTTPVHKEYPPVPPVPKISAPALPKTPNAKKAKQFSKTNVRPAMYAQDVQLAILFEGGKEKDHIARAASKTTKGTSTEKGVPGGGCAVGGYKDENGMLWWDEDEQWEWAALLPKDDDGRLSNGDDDSAWVDFACERRSSASSASSDKSVDALLDELEELVSTMGAGASAEAAMGVGMGSLGCLEPLPPRCVLAMPRPRPRARGAAAHGSAYLFPAELTSTRSRSRSRSTHTPASPSASFCARRANGAGRRRRAGPPPPLTLAPPSPFKARAQLGNPAVIGVAGPIASARHFKQQQAQQSQTHSFDDSFVAREAEFAWASLVGEHAPPKSAGLPKKSGRVARLFKGFGKAREQGAF